MVISMPWLSHWSQVPAAELGCKQASADLGKLPLERLEWVENGLKGLNVWAPQGATVGWFSAKITRDLLSSESSSVRKHVLLELQPKKCPVKMMIEDRDSS